MTAVEIVDSIVSNPHSDWKRLSHSLAALPPDSAAAESVIAAYRSQTCPPWLAAHLLGCIGHEVGYSVAKEILLSNARSFSEDYAAESMARIAPTQAFEDLRQIMFDAEPVRVRIGASCGLGATKHPDLLQYFLRAFDAGRLPRREVAQRLADCRPSDAWLMTWLRRPDVPYRRLACIVLFEMLTNLATPFPGRDVALAVTPIVDDEDFSLPSWARNRIREWAALPPPTFDDQGAISLVETRLRYCGYAVGTLRGTRRLDDRNWELEFEYAGFHRGGRDIPPKTVILIVDLSTGAAAWEVREMRPNIPSLS